MNAESILQRTRTMLGDASGVKFSDVQLQTALEQVLSEVNSTVPHVEHLQFAATVVDQKLTLPISLAVRNVLSVNYSSFDTVQKVAFRFDVNSPNVVQLMDLVQSGELNWDVKIVTGHQIEGLDGAETSTIPDYCEPLLITGTAAYALQMRNTQLAESANQESAHYQALLHNMHIYEAQFQHMLEAWRSAQPAIQPLLPDGPGWQLVE